VHLKLDTGMGRWGLSEIPSPTRDVVGVMSHLASAESDPEFTQQQIDRFREATAGFGRITRHIANSAGALRYPEARFDAARCGIALYGLSPFGEDPAADGLEPALRWDSELAQVKLLQPGSSTGYGRRHVAGQPTWIGVVPGHVPKFVSPRPQALSVGKWNLIWHQERSHLHLGLNDGREQGMQLRGWFAVLNIFCAQQSDGHFSNLDQCAIGLRV